MMWFRFRAWFMSLFRCSSIYTIKLSDVVWKTDELGWYWSAPVYKDREKCHLTGNYYVTGERLTKPDDSIIGIAFGEVVA